jgi:hypothetical protein
MEEVLGNGVCKLHHLLYELPVQPCLFVAMGRDRKSERECHTTRKVAMADEFQVGSWLMHHPDDFYSLCGASQNFFLIFETI